MGDSKELCIRIQLLNVLDEGWALRRNAPGRRNSTRLGVERGPMNTRGESGATNQDFPKGGSGQSESSPKDSDYQDWAYQCGVLGGSWNEGRLPGTEVITSSDCLCWAVAPALARQILARATLFSWVPVHPYGLCIRKRLSATTCPLSGLLAILSR